MESVKPSPRPAEYAAIPAQRSRRTSSLTQARVDAVFGALVARREYERGVARISGESATPPRQREASD